MQRSTQPIHITGVIRHCYLWATSGVNHQIYSNQNADGLREHLESNGVTVICVHGTADRTSSFSLVAERLVGQLPNTVTSIHLMAFDNRAKGAAIEDFAAQLKNYILATGNKRVMLMGHSRGGLVCAYFSEYLARQEEIDVQAVFTMSAPFGGSDKAIAPLTWISTSIDQMRPQSDFLINLNQKVASSSVPYYFFAAEKDELVPVSSAYVSGKEEYLTILRRHGHLSMMSSWKLVEHIRKRISHEDCSLTIATLQTDLSVYIEEYKERGHLFSGEFKLKILERLNAMISDLINEPSKLVYPEARTLGGFIKAFLSDTTLFDNHDTVLQAVNMPLNGLVQWSNTTTADFLLGLAIRYQNIALNRGELLALEVRPNEKQNL